MWISETIDKGQMLPSRASAHLDNAEAATEWLRCNLAHIPQHLRPPQDSFDEFGAFFSTFLISSFDVVETNPRNRRQDPDPPFGCRCPLCLRIASAPHLQAKKLYARDKKAAELLMTEYVAHLARENGIEIDDEHAASIVADERTRRSAAYMTYGHWLIRRLAGESDGPAILALWRLIARDPRGGMRPNFELKVDDFRQAEKRLLEAIRIAA
jgi:hypothetical protein